MSHVAYPLVSSRESTARVRVRYAETDKMGVVYYANYLVWFEVARCEWLRATGCTYRQLEEHGTILPVIGAHCDYRRSLLYDDDVAIRTRCTLLSPVRLRFDYTVGRAGVDEPFAEGYTEHAAVGPDGRLKRFSEDVRSLLL